MMGCYVTSSYSAQRPHRTRTACLDIPSLALEQDCHFSSCVNDSGLMWRFHCLTSSLVCLLAIASLDKISEFAAESFAHYCRQSLGDLIVITLDKYAPRRQIPHFKFHLNPGVVSLRRAWP